MNFKPTPLKSVASFITGIVSNYIFVERTIVQCMLIEGGTCVQPTWAEHAFDAVPITISLFVILIVYLVWSFVQKE